MKQITITKPNLSYKVNEAYKSLRTNLLFCGEDKKVIAITSSTPSEGKSTVSMNVALSLAESGKRVLFIDADMRKSMIADRSDVDRDILGLSHYLSHQASLQDIIFGTNVDNFNIIFSGVYPPNPAELLGNDAFKELLKVGRKVFDYVIIDTPPIANVTDGAIIAGESDGVVLVIAAGQVSYHFVSEILGQLLKIDTPFLGAVLNKVDDGADYYGKYYGKYYGE